MRCDNLHHSVASGRSYLPVQVGHEFRHLFLVFLPADGAVVGVQVAVRADDGGDNRHGAGKCVTDGVGADQGNLKEWMRALGMQT
jgi:hypothetical protein